MEDLLPHQLVLFLRHLQYSALQHRFGSSLLWSQLLELLLRAMLQHQVLLHP